MLPHSHRLSIREEEPPFSSSLTRRWFLDLKHLAHFFLLLKVMSELQRPE